MTEERAGENAEVDESIVKTTTEGSPQYGVGPFSVREVALGGVWIVAFIVSFFSMASEEAMRQLLFGGAVWTNGLDWILTIGVPTIAVFLVVLRRFSPDGIRRVGSLGIDQFASVAFTVSSVVWLTLLWRNVVVAVETGIWIYSWVVWVEFFLMLAGVVLTVLAPFIPPFAEDFAGRREVVAHRSARPIRTISPRPARPPRPAGQADDGLAVFAAGASASASENPYASGSTAQTTPVARYDDPSFLDNTTADHDAWAPADTTSTDATSPATTSTDTNAPAVASVQAEPEAAEPEVEPSPSHQAFWALVPEERDIVDEREVPIFRIGPTAWALVLEDRGEVFVVRHEDGRIGYLHDVSGVTRG